MFAKRFLLTSAGLVLSQLLSSATAQTFITAWGTYGSGDGQFDGPGGMAVDASGSVYVADYGNHRVQKFTSTGAYVTQWGTHGSGNGQFNGPEGVAVDAGGNVYVADFGNNRIQKFTGTGAYLTQWGTFGTGAGQFNSPLGVAVDASGNVYVADNFNNRIQKFTDTGTYLTRWGTNGSGNGQFNGPTGLAVDASGNVYVGDTGHNGIHNNRVQKFTASGVYLTQWGTEGSGDGQFAGPSFGGPWGVAVGASGSVYAVDHGNHRVQRFTDTGSYLTQWGTQGSGSGQFLYPYSVATDAAGNVYVADLGNNRIQKFGFAPTSVQSVTWGSMKARHRGERGATQPAAQGK